MHSKPALSASPEPTRGRRERAATPPTGRPPPRGASPSRPMLPRPRDSGGTRYEPSQPSPAKRATGEPGPTPPPRRGQFPSKSGHSCAIWKARHHPAAGPLRHAACSPVGRVGPKRRDSGACGRAPGAAQRGAAAVRFGRGRSAAARAPGGRRGGGASRRGGVRGRRRTGRAAGPEEACGRGPVGPRGPLGRRPAGGATMARDARTSMPAGTAPAVGSASRGRVRRAGDRAPPGA